MTLRSTRQTRICQNYGKFGKFGEFGEFGEFMENKVDHLEQGFPTCGTRTTGGTHKAARWYAETFQIQNLTLNHSKIS